MKPFSLRRLTEEDIPQVARSLHGRNLATGGDASAGMAAGERSLDDFRRDIQWRMAGNPSAEPRLGIGHGLQDSTGTLQGILLMFPAPFLIGERRLRGLCGGAFFVEASFRLQGFLLFRRYLAESGIDFWYATTCNQSSGALWSKHGARPVGDSRQEYLFVLRSGPVIEEVLRRRGPGWLAAQVGRVAGGITSPFLRPGKGSGEIEVEACRDWDRLGNLAERLRDPRVITAERTSRILEWKYSGSPPHARNKVLRFRDRRGREGWISLGASRRGAVGQIQAWTVLDWVAPRDDFDAADLLRAVVEHFSGECDLVAVQGPDWLGSAALAVGARPRQLPGPSIFVRGLHNEANGRNVRAEIFPADGDTPLGIGAPEALG